MRRALGSILLCLVILTGCGEAERTLVPPEADPDAVWYECWPGTVTELFTEGGGTDIVEVLALDAGEDYGTLYLTLGAETIYLHWDTVTGEQTTISREDLAVGDWVEMDCRCHQGSGLREALTVTVIDGPLPIT